MRRKKRITSRGNAFADLTYDAYALKVTLEEVMSQAVLIHLATDS